VDINLLDKWKCVCGHNSVEEVMVDVIVASRVTDVPVDCVDFDYGVTLNEGGVVDRYQCEQCGEMIAETAEELLEKLKAAQ